MKKFDTAEEAKEHLRKFRLEVQNFAMAAADELSRKFVKFVDKTFPEDDVQVVGAAAAAATTTIAMVEKLEEVIKKKFPEARVDIDLARNLEDVKHRKMQEELFPPSISRGQAGAFAIDAVSKLGSLYKASLVGFMKCLGEKQMETEEGLHIRLGPEDRRDIASFALSAMDFLVSISSEHIASLLDEDYHNTRANLIAQISDCCDCESCDKIEKAPSAPTSGMIH